MALQTGVFKFTGKLDNVIGYRRNGKYFFRSMPDKVRQTAATKRAARSFGIVSRKNRLLRNALLPYLDMRYDGTIVNRLNKTLILAGRNNVHALQGFHFNRHTGIEKMFVDAPRFTENGTLRIPSQELLPQGTATHLEISLIAVRVNFARQLIIDADVTTEIIDLQAPFAGAELSVDLPGEGALFMVLQCRACTTCNGRLYPSGDRRYMAADILRVVVPAELARIPSPKKGTWKHPVHHDRNKRFLVRRQHTLPPTFPPQQE